MTPQQAAIELEHAIAQAIVKYEKEVPGICVGVYVDRFADGFKVKPRLKMKGPVPSQTTPNDQRQSVPSAR